MCNKHVDEGHKRIILIHYMQFVVQSVTELTLRGVLHNSLMAMDPRHTHVISFNVRHFLSAKKWDLFSRYGLH